VNALPFTARVTCCTVLQDPDVLLELLGPRYSQHEIAINYLIVPPASSLR